MMNNAHSTGGYRFVGRARKTEYSPASQDAPRERRVELPDGRVVWAEQGSALWAKAESASTDERQELAEYLTRVEHGIAHRGSR